MQNRKPKQQQEAEAEAEAEPRQAKDWRVGPVLWEVICSTLLTSRAEQIVVQQIIGETLIQESLLLHREAVALCDILTAFTRRSERRSDCTPSVCSHEDGIRHDKCVQPPTQLRSSIKDGHGSLVENVHPVCASPPPHHRRNIIKGDGLRPHSQPSAFMSKETYGNQKTQVSRSHYKTLSGKECKKINVDGLHRLSKAKKDDVDGNGITRLNKIKREDVNGNGVHTLSKVWKEDTLRPLSIPLSSASSSSDMMQISVKNGALPQVCDRVVDDSGDDATTLDFWAFLRERGNKINAYDIDEVVHDLHEAFARERVHLNQLVEQLRRALDECIDSYPTVQKKLGIDHSQEIKDHIWNFNEVEMTTKELPLVVKTPTHSEGKTKELRRVVKTPTHSEVKHLVGPKFSSSQVSYLKKPRSAPTLRNTNVEKSLSKFSSATLSKTTIKTHKPPSKQVLAPQNTNKSPILLVKEGNKMLS